MTVAKSAGELPDAKERTKAIQQLFEEFGVLDRSEVFGLLSRQWNIDLSNHEAVIIQHIRDLVESGAIKNHEEDDTEYSYSPQPTVIIEEVSVSKSKAWATSKNVRTEIKGLQDIKNHGFDMVASSKLAPAITISHELPHKSVQATVFAFIGGKDVFYLSVEKIMAPFRLWIGRAGEFSPKNCLGILDSLKMKGWPARNRNIVFQIPQTTVSAFRDGRVGHLSLWFEEDEYRIFDLNSTNGTFCTDIPSEKFSGVKNLEITSVPSNKNSATELPAQRLEGGLSHHIETPQIIQLADDFRMIVFEANQGPKSARVVAKFLRYQLSNK